MIIAAKSNNIKPEYQLEIEKLKIMMSYEKQSIEKYGYFENNTNATDIHREIILNYYNSEFPKLQKLEEELETQMQKTTDLYYRLSSFFPTTEYLAVTNEISSKGYKTLYEFYNSVKQIKEDFFKEYMEKVYFSPQPAKVEPFLKGDDNVFKSKPALPDYYLQGFFFTLLWITAIAILSFYSFKKSLFSLPEKDKNIPEPKDIKIEKGKIMSWYVHGDFLNRHLYNFLSNQIREFIKMGYSFKVYLDEKLLNIASKKQNFLYLCHPSSLPGYIKVKNFITLVSKLMRTEEAQLKEIINRFSLDAIWNKNISQLNYIEKGSLILSILFMKPVDVYLIDDIGRGMLLEHCFILEEKMTDLKNNGAAILFLTTDNFVIRKDHYKSCHFYKSDHWIYYIKGYKKDPECGDIPEA